MSSAIKVDINGGFTAEELAVDRVAIAWKPLSASRRIPPQAAVVMLTPVVLGARFYQKFNADRR